ncbi:diguanylate cyclase (GGDEF) domain-containing protein [Pseudobutyrivibrio sp. 49]|uniref:EAL domain-containing protein n=1 Tax=unclassified Pseudobutyrivibrio TaxID=2638619 RepID=UPI00087EA227|nr:MULTISPECIES: EAL domain-containing protein [unclassified Pseudobutyrivibrio]SDH29960.1 diguanylate cyclase (GGDEF) domain-containing protein [Pseudobutyrivibrio sp. 49]SFN51233.1 diguanylate cyclase (GGDEF) domain-containing protein [Pseudobutyrivibrio sp. UC1225]
MEKYQFGEIERAALEQLNIAMAIYQYIDKRVVTLLVTDGMCKLMGMERKDVTAYLDDDMYKDTHPDDKARVADAALKFAAGGDNFDCVYRTMSKLINDYVILHSHGEHFFTPNGTMLSSTIYMVEGLNSDNPLTEKLASNFDDIMTKESLIRDNFYDTLTGLPNMSYFLQLAEAGGRRYRKEGHAPAMVFFDLTGMKYFNEKYGLREGDNLIIATANTLKNYFTNENCGRMGSDHFAVYTKSEGLEDILKKMFEDMKYANEGRTVPIHVGIYSDAFEEISASTAFDRAKMASDREKGAYVSKYSYYDANIHESATNYEYVINNFDRAMEEGWIKPYYQQIIRSVNGQACDEEALARWIDPVRGLIPPQYFIYVLEDIKLIHKLDLYILDCVLRDLEEVEKKGYPIVPVSINLSRFDFQLCDIVEEIKKRVEKSSIAPDKITIEITESVSELEIGFVIEQIRRFHEAGFKVWMDDFGSGYSSLNMLQKFDVDLIKFDMSFMREFSTNKRNHVIMTQLIQMARKLGIDTVVEGVETADQVKFLREIGAGKLQGFHFAKPIPLEEWYTITETNVGNVIEQESEVDYYDAITRTNVMEPDVEADNNWGSNEFLGQIPTGILELREDGLYVVRYNKSFASFLVKLGYIEQSDLGHIMIKQKALPSDQFLCAVESTDSKDWVLVEDAKEAGLIIDVYIKRIGQNPVNDNIAFAVSVITIKNDGS